MRHTVAERSWRDADFVCISIIQRSGYGKSVVTLAVTGKTISGRVVRRRVMQVFERLRWLLTGGR
jgi:hypothetical protein